MIQPNEVRQAIKGYKSAKIATLGSHSALDICDGARDEGFETWVYCQKDRDLTYSRYFARRKLPHGVRGIVERAVVLSRFSDLLKKENLQEMRDHQVVFVPNRALTSYISVDDVENRFSVPLFGTRSLLRSEERGGEKDYYHLVEAAGLPYAKRFARPEKIDRLVIVKLPHAMKRLERGFFTSASFEEFEKKSKLLVSKHVVTKQDLESARIEEYVIGPVFNLEFFRTPLTDEKEDEIELIGVDWVLESSLDGLVRLPAQQQLALDAGQSMPEFNVCGHNSSVLRESLIEKAFSLAGKFVEATKKLYPPGIIGPFSLQTCVDKDLKFYICDISPRISSGTNAYIWSGHPYGNALWSRRMSAGRRIALEIKTAMDQERLPEVVT